MPSIPCLQDHAEIYEADQDSRLQGQERVRGSPAGGAVAHGSAAAAMRSLRDALSASHSARCCWHLSQIRREIQNSEASQPAGS